MTTVLVPSRWCGCKGSQHTPPVRSGPSGGGRAGEGKADCFSYRWHYNRTSVELGFLDPNALTCALHALLIEKRTAPDTAHVMFVV